MFIKEEPSVVFLGGPVVMNPPANARDMGLIPGPGRLVQHDYRSLCA